MITDPLPDDLVHDMRNPAAAGLRGFSRLSNPHMSMTGGTCVGHMPAAGRLAARQTSVHCTYGFRLALSLSPGGS